MNTNKLNLLRGVTLIELLVVVTIIAVLLSMAMPSYRSYILRVNRTEAIRLLLQASMCQERIHAGTGKYNSSLCRPVGQKQTYQFSYRSNGSNGTGFSVAATPKGSQLSDPCGSLTLDHNGTRTSSSKNVSTAKCWNGR